MRILKSLSVTSCVLLVLSCAKADEEKFVLDNSLVNSPESLQVSSYADVLDPARSAVVSVTTTSIVETFQGRGTNPMEDLLRRFYGLPERNNRNGQPQERRIPNGLGSGVIVSSDGYVVTNNHVVSDESGEPADEITVHLNDGSQIQAELVGRDERTDIALLKIEKEDLPSIKMADSDILRVGDLVFAIGNPLGVGQTSTMGIISALERTNLGLLGSQGYENFIQTDAAINRGNSGGALVDAQGRLVGINTAIYSRTGGNIGIGFAIPSKMVRTVILELIENGTVRRGYLGVSIRDLDPDMAEAFNLDSPNGVLIESVQKGTPADKAGMKRGDIILKVESQEVEDVADLRLRIASIRPGTAIPVSILRDDDRIELEVKLGSLDDPEAVVSASDSPLDGVGLQPLSEDLASEWNLSEGEGLLITEMDPRSPFARTLAVGMVIIEVNDIEVSTIGDITDALKSGVNKLWVSYRGNRGYLALRIP